MTTILLLFGSNTIITVIFLRKTSRTEAAASYCCALLCLQRRWIKRDIGTTLTPTWNLGVKQAARKLIDKMLVEHQHQKDYINGFFSKMCSCFPTIFRIRYAQNLPNGNGSKVICGKRLLPTCKLFNLIMEVFSLISTWCRISGRCSGQAPPRTLVSECSLLCVDDDHELHIWVHFTTAQLNRILKLWRCLLIFALPTFFPGF